ncbi:phosphosulfolactate synthase [Pseudonocardia sp. GCM10023141]|uniref:phosphosulfolactate synthase n=1 Tax=Pseudonocardia sp. GCM10023141 TaxID=3252653 RepID=UPI00360CEA2F
MWDCPSFLRLPARTSKPRSTGLTHVLDKGIPPAALEGVLSSGGAYIDIVKIGWGIGYVDRGLKQRMAVYQDAGVRVCLGGTLLEIAVAQGKLPALTAWATGAGIEALEVSNGLGWLEPDHKQRLVAELSRDFVVLAEAGMKDAALPVAAAEWTREMTGDLAGGAVWVIAEGRESGTVGLYEPNGTVRVGLVEELVGAVPVERIIFEAPTKAQQTWFVKRFGADVNLGNIAMDDVLALETLRVGLRADTARLP